MAQTKESKSIVTLPKPADAMEIFSTPKGLEPIINAAKKVRDDFYAEGHTTETEQGRKAIGSMARKMASLKARIDEMGLEQKKIASEVPQLIQTERNRAKSELEKLRDEIRKPLNDWENEEAARIKALQEKFENITIFKTLEVQSSTKGKELISQLSSIDVDESYAELIEDAIEAKAEALERLEILTKQAEKHEAEQAELEQLRKEKAEREQREAEEARKKQAEAERQRLEQEAADKAKREAAEREQELKRKAEEAEKRAKEAEQAAQKAAEEAKRKAEEQAEQKAAQERAEAAKREADIEHRRNVNNSIVDALCVKHDDETEPLTDDQAKKVVSLIASGKVPNVSINY